MANVTNLTFEEGFIVVHRESGPDTRYALADVLRAADIPVLTIESLTLLSTGMHLLMLLIKTLIDRDILDETWHDGYDLQYIVEELENLGAEW